MEGFTPLQKKDLKITSHSAADGPEHQILPSMSRAQETEKDTHPLCLLSQQLPTLS